MYIGIRVKYPLFLCDWNETWFLSTDFEKYTFHKNPSSGSRVVTWGERGGLTDRPTNMTKLIGVFRNLANAS